MLARHHALVAGFALTLVLGAAAPAPAAAEEPVAEASATDSAAMGIASDANDAAAVDGAVAGDDTPSDYQDAPAATAVASASLARSVMTPASDEMKYFTLYESGKNYDQGFSRWDGYHAMGYYQFDRRYSLVSLMRYCYNYDSATFSMFAPVLERAAELSSSSTVIFDKTTGSLTEIGQLAEDAWHAAYAANPALFAALQDNYAITNYYQPTERWLKTQGIDISSRADCVKGLVWSLTNLFGTGGVRKYLTAAELSNDMTDREFVNAIVDSLPSSLAKYNSNTVYHTSWINRYEQERATCLAYIAEDEAAAGNVADEPGAVDEGTSDGDVTGDTGAGDAPGGEGTGSDSSADSSGSLDSVPDGSNDAPALGDGANGVEDDTANTDAPGDATENATGNTGSSADDDVNAGDTTTGGSSSSGASGGTSDSSSGSDSELDAEPSTPVEDEAANGAGTDASTDDAAGGDASTGSDASGSGSNDQQTPGGNTGGAGSDTGDATTGTSGDGSSEQDSPSEKNPADGAGDNTSTNEEEDSSKSGDGAGIKTEQDEGKGSGGDGNKDVTDGSGSETPDNTKVRTTSDSGAQVANTSTMPDTSDVIVMAVLASGSLASFGATAVLAGKRKLRDAGHDGDQEA